MELKELLCLLEERLVQHDNNRKEVQDKLQGTCSIITEEADLLEEKINKELRVSFNSAEEKILNLIERLNNKSNSEEENEGTLIKQVKEELSSALEYEIQKKENADNFVDSYELKVNKENNEITINDKDDIKNVINKLKEHLNSLHESVIVIQNKLTEICTKRRNEAEELKKRINIELETSFVEEDSRIQKTVNSLKEKSNDNNDDVIEELKTKAKLTLLLNQKYSLENNDDNEYKLNVTKEASLKRIDFEERKPLNTIISSTNRGEFSLSFTFFSDDEISVLKATKTSFNVKIKVWDKSKSENINSKTIIMGYVIDENQPLYFTELFNSNTTYYLKMQIKHQDLSSKWSDNFYFTTPEFNEFCVWKECPDYAYEDKKYSVDENNPRISSMIGDNCCTIIGNTPIPPNKVTSWNIKILNSKNNDGNNIFIGVAPFDIDQNVFFNFNGCGWYLYCHESTLDSGPPHNYKGKSYGPRKWVGEYVHTGDNVGVVMDTTKSELSFVVSGVSYGVAFERIPLDKPLVPCVLLGEMNDSIELDLASEVKENVNKSVSVPSNIREMNNMWDSITLTWDAVEEASFYQIEMDGNKSGDITALNSFTKMELLDETEYSFRVRTVKDGSVSEWSDVIKVKTVKAPDFSECIWKKMS